MAMFLAPGAKLPGEKAAADHQSYEERKQDRHHQERAALHPFQVLAAGDQQNLTHRLLPPTVRMNISSSDGSTNSNLKIRAWRAADSSSAWPFAPLRSLNSARPGDSRNSVIDGSVKKRCVTLVLHHNAITRVARLHLAHLPSSTARPWSTRQMASHSFSTWSMRWVENRIVLPLLLEFQQRLLQQRRIHGIEPGGRLVHDDQLRIVQQRGDELDLLLHALGELLRLLLASTRQSPCARTTGARVPLPSTPRGRAAGP